MDVRKLIWPQPTLYPLPAEVGGAVAVLSLDGDDWTLCRPYTHDNACWQRVHVPDTFESSSEPYAYRRRVTIPEAWKGRRILLRFDGANCLAAVLVDGQEIRRHYGGFVSWDCEITAAVTPGQTHEVTVVMEDRVGEISTFQYGGLIRSVWLYSLPEGCISRLHVRTTFDGYWRDATLHLELCTEESEGPVTLTMTDPEGAVVLNETVSVPGGKADIAFSIASPRKWDSEHPHLYTLTASIGSGEAQETVRRTVGFRQIDMDGQIMKVNGQPIKLRGVNRHDQHPLHGYTHTIQEWERDLQLFKDANINFVRTSHYPPSTEFLDLCDRLGMYVEDEAGVAFLGYGTQCTENDPERLPLFMNQFAEWIERDRSHPCVILWSLANESHWGDNLEAMYRHVRRIDPERPTIFSFPFTQGDDAPVTEIWSVHYARWYAPAEEMGDAYRRSTAFVAPRPVLHDESTHIPCYCTAELKRDPAVRDFWGETIERFWHKIWQTPGALGCAIWGSIDHTSVRNGMLSGPPWGIVDAWRRKKPEYWHVRKAYAPVRVIGCKAEEAGVRIMLENRFNHTNLTETTLIYGRAGQEAMLSGPDAQPGQQADILLPSTGVPGEALPLSILDSLGRNVQEEVLHPWGEVCKPLPDMHSVPQIQETADAWHFSGPDFSVKLDKATGLLKDGFVRGQQVLVSGPALHLTGFDLGQWCCKDIRVMPRENCVQIDTSGTYDDVGAAFSMRLDDTGLLHTTYTLTDMPYHSPNRVAITSSITSQGGGYTEVGLSWRLHESMQTLSWQRKGQWSSYPEDHIGRLSGTAAAHPPFGEWTPDSEPAHPWRLDEREWPVFGADSIGGIGCTDFRSMKAHISEASLHHGNAAMTAYSNHGHAVRAELLLRDDHHLPCDHPSLRYEGAWQQRFNRHHTANDLEAVSRQKGDTCTVTFTGTGIAWLATRDHSCGKAHVYLDGVMLRTVDLNIPAFAKNPRGYQRTWNNVVFVASGLSMGEHTLTIEVAGEGSASSVACDVSINSLIILDGKEHGDVKFIVNDGWNYPLLSWGCYEKEPILVETGFTGGCLVRLGVMEERSIHNDEA